MFVFVSVCLCVLLVFACVSACALLRYYCLRVVWLVGRPSVSLFRMFRLSGLLFVRPFVCASARLFVNLPFRFLVCLRVSFLCAYLFVGLFVRRSVRLCLRLSVHLFDCLYASQSFCFAVALLFCFVARPVVASRFVGLFAHLSVGLCFHSCARCVWLFVCLSPGRSVGRSLCVFALLCCVWFV